MIAAEGCEGAALGSSLLDGEDGPVILLNEAGRSRYVLICEHAANRIPRKLGNLGFDPTDLNRHIAWDLGAERVARVLSRLLDAPLALQRYSRLVYDCNRPPESPDAMPALSEATPVPGNANLTPDDRLARTAAIYRPFHNAIADLLDHRSAHRTDTIVVSIHSFTPVYKGKARAVELGILFDRDPALARLLIKGFPNVVARLNEPYGPADGVLHTLNLHASPRGLAHAMIEVRNDLISDERRQDEWAQRLSVPLIQAAAKQEGRK